jgi:hypothetical protein
VLQVDTSLETSASPESVRAALLDFSERRPEIWPGLAPGLYEVYEVGETTAEVKEGSHLPIGDFWARELYDWSDPATVKWTVKSSNFCAPGTTVSATLTPRDGGGTHVALHWERSPTTLLGKVIGRAIVLTKGKPVAASFQKALDKLES